MRLHQLQSIATLNQYPMFLFRHEAGSDGMQLFCNRNHDRKRYRPERM